MKSVLLAVVLFSLEAAGQEIQYRLHGQSFRPMYIRLGTTSLQLHSDRATCARFGPDTKEHIATVEEIMCPSPATPILDVAAVEVIELGPDNCASLKDAGHIHDAFTCYAEGTLRTVWKCDDPHRTLFIRESDQSRHCILLPENYRGK